MPTYTFHTLSPADFEQLVRDLLKAELGLCLQSFTPGKDQGIDLLHASGPQSTIVQCKHFKGSGFASLKRAIERQERPKIVRLAPHRYILCTSVGLTPRNKEELLSLLSPYCKGTGDILGCDDLNGFLRDLPDIEVKHHKLWLTSVPILERILRNGQAVWNAMERSEIERKLCLYVETEAFDRCIKILTDHHYVVISGIPGIGKTTLAQMLVTHFLNEDYELLAVRDHVEQALEGFSLGPKQVIYYDDILGRSSLIERLGKNEDEALVQLLTEAKRRKNTRVILTTREYILAEARQKYERLAGAELDVPKCIVAIEDYTRANRARILYNHLYFSSLPTDYIDSVLADGAYKWLIDHRNYNPRVVEWMTGEMGTAGVPPEAYASTFRASLDNPCRLREYAFEHQISADARHVLLILGSMRTPVALEALDTAWQAGQRPRLSAIPGDRHSRLTAALKHLDGSFVRTQRLAQSVAVDFHNPSIRDFVLRRIGGDPAAARELLATAVCFEQVSTLVCLADDGTLRHSPSGLIPDAGSLRPILERTIVSGAAAVHRVVLLPGRESVWSADDASLGARFSKIAQWASFYGGDAFVDFVEQLFHRVDARGLLPGESAVSFAGFLQCLLDASCEPLEARRETIHRIVDLIDGSLDKAAEASAWIEWAKFRGSHHDRLEVGDWTALQHRARVWCESQAELIVDNDGSAEEIRSVHRELADVAKGFDMSIDDTLEWLESCALEREEPEPDYDDEHAARRHEGTDHDADSDAAIDRLFSSLRDPHSEEQT